jgi:Ca2+/Na+ antiporter
LGTISTIANFVVALVVILLGATFFTNPVEILSGRLGTPQEDVGTALPESVIAAVAILELDITGGEIVRATDIGFGAILGAPFVQATLALIFQSTTHVTFGLLFIPWKFAALGLFAALLALTSGGLKYPVLSGLGKLRSRHLVIGGAFYLTLVLGGGSSCCPMGGAKRRQR